MWAAPSGMWPQQSTWVMFPLPVMVAIPAAPPQRLMVMYEVWNTGIGPVTWVWLVCWLAGSEQLRRTMENPLKTSFSDFLHITDGDTETFYHISWQEAYSRDKNVTNCAVRRIRENSKRMREFREAWNALRHWKKSLTVIFYIRARSSYSI